YGFRRELSLLAFISLLALPGVILARNIGADPPSRTGCNCNTPQQGSAPAAGAQSPGSQLPGPQRSNTTTSISRTEGNLIEAPGGSTTQSTAGTTVDFRPIYNSYNADGSRAVLDTVMGYGWTHTYNQFLFTQFGAMFRYDGIGRVTKYGVA